MSAQVKSYFLAPSWDYPPNGPIKLGNIILSPTSADKALAESPIPISSDITTSSGHGFRTTKHNVTWSRESHISGRFGIWTSFLQFVGIGVGVEMSKDRSEIYEFDEMITEECYPTDEALAKMIEGSAEVQKVITRYMEHRILRLTPIKLYVIVGVKTVKGARVKTGYVRERGLESEVSLDGLAAAGVPVLPGGVTLGPSLELSKKSSDEVSFAASDDFVFAYRVRKVEIRKGGELKQKDYREGALYGAGRKANEEHVEGGGDEKPMMIKLDDGDFEGTDQFEVANGLYDDDGQEVVVIMPDIN